MEISNSIGSKRKASKVGLSCMVSKASQSHAASKTLHQSDYAELHQSISRVPTDASRIGFYPPVQRNAAVPDKVDGTIQEITQLNLECTNKTKCSQSNQKTPNQLENLNKEMSKRNKRHRLQQQRDTVNFVKRKDSRIIREVCELQNEEGMRKNSVRETDDLAWKSLKKQPKSSSALVSVELSQNSLKESKKEDFVEQIRCGSREESFDEFSKATQSIDLESSILIEMSPFESDSCKRSDRSDSTFIVEFEERDNVSDTGCNLLRSQGVGAEHIPIKETKCDRDVKESEKQQKKIYDLNTKTIQLEKRVTSLREENEVLKKKTDEQRLSEEKVKNLKRRNVELASIARRLEEKVKLLQHDHLKKTTSSSPTVDVTMKSTTHNTRSKEKSNDKSKFILDKDKTIEILREKCQELIRQLRSVQGDDIQNKDIYAEHLELENIIKQAARERLMLERQLVEQQNDPEIEAQLAKSIHLEEKNADLMDKVEKLTTCLENTERLEIEVVQRRIEVETLEKEMLKAKEKCLRLTEDVEELIDKNTQLAIVNTDVQRQMEEMQEMAKQFNSLQESLSNAQSESKIAKSQAISWNEKVQTLEVELKCMKDVEQKRRQIEVEKRDLQERLQLNEQQMEKMSQERDKEKSKAENSQKKLESRLLEVEQMYEKQLELNEQMKGKVNELEKRLEISLIKPSAMSTVVQTDTPITGNTLFQSIYVHGHEKTGGSCNSVSSQKEIEENKNMNNFSVDTLMSNGGISKDFEAGLDVCHDIDTKIASKAVDVESWPVQNGVVMDGTEENILKVFQAIYNYDPDQCSPNDEPDTELVFSAGDYIFVCGDMDEDGFYFGELLDGRRGLVPSNFVRRLKEDEMIDFYSTINVDVVGLHSLIDLSSTHEIETLSGVDDINTSLDISFVNDHVNLREQGIPDPPVDVQLESGPDHGTLMVYWLPVTITTAGTSNGARVSGYSIYINGKKVKQTLNPTGDHLLLEFEDLTILDTNGYVTVRTFTISGQESLDSVPALITPQLMLELTIGEQNDCLRLSETNGDDKENANDQNNKNSEISLNLFTANDLKTVEDVNQPINVCVKLKRGHDVNSSIHHEDKIFDDQSSLNQKKINNQITTTSLYSNFSSPDNLSEDPVILNQTLSMNSVISCRPIDALSKPMFNASSIWQKVCKNSNNDQINSNNKSEKIKSNSENTISLQSDRVEVGLISCKDEKISSDSHMHSLQSTVTSVSERNDETIVTSNDCLELTTITGFALNDFDALDKKRLFEKREDEADIMSELDGYISSGSELMDNNAMTSKRIHDDIPDSDLIDYSDDGGESLVESIEYDGDVLVRIFIALFSYDPATMSPNPDAVSEELSFQEGQIVKIYGEKDADGFFLGEINNRRGLIPCNMVSEVHVDDSDIAAQLLEEGHQSATSSRASSRTSDFTSRTHSTLSVLGAPDDERLSPLGEPARHVDDFGDRYVIALYNYDPQELSPNSDIDEELSFQKGDIIKIMGDLDDDGFYYGQLNERCGLVPSNFIKDAPSSAIYYSHAIQMKSSNIILHTGNGQPGPSH